MTSRSQEIKHRGRSYRVIDEIFVRRRKYLILRKLATVHNERLLAFDQGAGGALRTILCLPDDSTTWQRIHVLKRLSQASCLPRIVDFGRRRDKAFIVLTWIEGIDLSEYLHRIRTSKVQPPEPFEAIRLIRGLAHGLRTLHEHAQVIHGDLKPCNLIITRKPSRLHMVDFGSAWPTEKTMARQEGDGISPTYSAPELQNGLNEPLCHVDQFSISVILYQLLTQRIPYSDLGGKAGRDGLRIDMEGTLELPSKESPYRIRLSRKHWRQIDQLVGRGLEFDPQQRFPTTNAWLSAIEKIYLQLKLTRVNSIRQPTFLESCIDWISASFRAGQS